MDDVMAVHAVLTLDLARTAGFTIDSAAVFAGLPFSEEDLRRARRRRIGWDDYNTILDRWCEACGGIDAATVVAADLDRASPWVDWLFGTVVGVGPMLQIWSLMVPRVWRPLTLDVTALPDGAYRLHLKAKPGYRDPHVLYMVSRGSLATTTRRLGLPPAVVTLTERRPGEAVYRLVPATEHTARHPEDHVVIMLDMLERMPVDELPGGYGGVTDLPQLGPSTALPAHQARLDAATRAWRLTPTQALVLEEVVAGRANKEIGEELGMAVATVEIHLTAIYRRSGIRGRTALVTKFWTTDWEEASERSA